MGFHSLPWVVDQANDWLAENARRDWSVLEFGSGSSTIWFSANCGGVLAVEHNPLWAVQVRPNLGANASVVVKSRPYAWYPRTGQFDFVLVDERDRVRCVAKSLSRVKPGGVLMLDNSERSWYRPAFEALAGWEMLGEAEQCGLDYCGFAYPGWRTTWWRKPN